MRWVFTLTAVAFVMVSVTAQEKKLQYPETKKGTQVDERPSHMTDRDAP